MTDTTKRYRLKKDYVTPRFTYAKGADVSYLGGMYVIGIETFTEEALKTTPEWFEEVLPVSEPVKEMVGVTVTEMNTYNSRVHYGYSFNVHSVDIDCGKIKQAIESALNDTVEDSKIKELESLLEYYQAEFNANQDKVYTQAEVDAIRADTWYAARKITDKVVGEIDFKDGDRCPFYEKYFNSINDYLSSLNLNSNDTGKEDNETKSANWRSENLSKQSAPVDTGKEHLCTCKIGQPYNNLCCLVHGQIPPLKSAPEPSALPNKEYEIVTCFDNKISEWKETDWHYYIPKGDKLHISNCEDDKCKIRSVRRLPDNTLWSVKQNTNKGIIESFLIITEENSSNSITAHLHRKENIGKIAVKVIGDLGATFPNQLLEDLELPTPTQPVEDKPVLFTTEDNQPVYMGETYWKVTILDQCWKANETVMREELANPPSYFKYFSTKEAAEQYILENKPCLSVKDVMGFFRAYFETKNSMNPTHGEIRDAMIEVAKQKFKQ